MKPAHQSLKQVINRKAELKLQRQAKNTLADFRSLESGPTSMALDVKSFQVDPVYPKHPLTATIQNAEINGDVLKNQDYKYHATSY